MDYTYTMARGSKDRPLAFYRLHEPTDSVSRLIHGEWMRVLNDDVLASKLAPVDGPSFRQALRVGRFTPAGDFLQHEPGSMIGLIERVLFIHHKDETHLRSSAADLTRLEVKMVSLTKTAVPTAPDSFLLQTSDIRFAGSVSLSLAVTPHTALYATQGVALKAYEDRIFRTHAETKFMLIRIGDSALPWAQALRQAAKQEQEKAEAAAQAVLHGSSLSLDNAGFAARMRHRRGAL